MLSIIASLLLIGSIPQCEPDWNNPIDESGTKFESPAISFNPDSSSISNDGDTVHFDSVTVYLVGNKSLSRFQYKLDDEDWSTEWEEAGPYIFRDLSDGKHTLHVSSKYKGGDSTVYGEISFYVLVKGYKPEFSSTKDTIISSFLGKDIKVNVRASGAAPLKYEWFKKGDSSGVLSGDTLKLSEFSISDTATYYCIASNKYGSATSRSFIVKYRPSTGGIKGVIISASDSAKLSGVLVVLAPSNDSITTDSSGSFKFEGLSERDYSVSISISGYYDSTVKDLSVNDSNEVNLSKIALSEVILSNVIYNGNENDDGSVPEDTSDYKPGEVVTIADNTGDLIKAGYEFSGWSRKRDGSSQVYNADDTLLMGKVNDTLYAVWKIKQYSITFNGNNNTSGTTPEEIKKDFSEKVTIPDEGTLERAGYSFKEWNTNDEGTGKSYSNGDEYTIPDSSITLYAIWDKLPTFKVTYDDNNSNGGEIPSDTNSYYNGQKVTVKGNPGNLVKTDNNFSGWCMDSIGSGECYNSGATFSMPSNPVMLYAKWTTKPTFMVVYDGNTNTGGTAPDTVNFIEDQEVTIADSGSLFKTGYSFSGWNTVQNGGGTSYSPGDKHVFDTVTIILYAQWTEIKFTLTYHGNGNTGGSIPSPLDYTFGKKATVAATGNLVKTGYSFVNWNTDSLGNGDEYSVGDEITMNSSDINLYAIWSINNYTITYHGNGSTGGSVPIPTNHLFGSKVTIKTPGDMEKTGHTFLNWNTDSLGDGLDYNSGDQITVSDSDIDLYALWDTNKYIVWFNSLEGSAVDSVSVNYGGTVPLPNNPDKRSYIFSNWCRDIGCTIPWNFSTDVVTDNDTLYAKWVIRDVDGNIYTEVKIGEQVWMVENLKVTRYNDSTLIPHIMTASSWISLYSCENNPCIYKPGYCWYDNDSSTNCFYGALYSWAVVGTNKLAPTGWHVPTVTEINSLKSLLNDGGIVDVAGGKLKEAGTEHWNVPNEGATDSVGYKALPGGSRNYDGNGTFEDIGHIGYWWLSTQVTMGSSYYYTMSNDRLDLLINYSGKSSGFNVRCIRDW